MGRDGIFFCVIGVLLIVSDFTQTLYLSTESATKLVNETFIVICRDERGRPVEWRGPRGLLGRKSRPKVITASYGTSIIFNTTTADDAGTYSCSTDTEKKEFQLSIEVADNYPTTSTSSNYIPKHNNRITNINRDRDFQKPIQHNKYHHATKAPMRFMDTKPEQFGNEGEDVTIRCEVKGAQVSWSAYGIDLVEPKYNIMGDGLLIKKVDRSDSGIYICKAVQPSTGNVEEKKISFTVQHPPNFPQEVYAQQEQAYGYENGTVNLTCEVEAVPPPRFEWKNLDSFKPTVRPIRVSSHISVLQLRITDKSVFGNYKCTASNKLGILEKYFNLEEGVQPNPPKSIALISANDDSLELEILGPDTDSGEEEGEGEENEEQAENTEEGEGQEEGAQTVDDLMQPKWYNVQFRRTTVDETDEDLTIPWESQDFNITEENTYKIEGLRSGTEYEKPCYAGANKTHTFYNLIILAFTLIMLKS